MDQVSFDKWTSLFLVAAIQGIFLSIILLIHKKGNKTANRLLGLFIFTFSLMIGFYVAFWSGYLRVNVHLIGLTDPLYLLFGPLLWAYLSVWRDNKFPSKFFAHLLPCFIHFAIYLPYYLSGAEKKHAIIHIARTHGTFLYYMVNSFSFLWMLSLFVYAVVMIRMLKESKTELNNIGHSWMRLTVIFFSCYVISCISYFSLYYAGLIRIETDYAISFAMASFIYLVGYLGFRQPEIFHGFSKNKIAVRYERSSLSAEKANDLKLRLLDLMEKEKIYVQSDLKQQQLAEKLSVSVHHLSQVINEHFKQNFPDFINHYRINEAKRLLADQRHSQEKILSICFDVGYSNKATFNSAFKKYAGMAPSEFRQRSVSDADLKKSIDQV